jgi:SAM-dependent methyltransferase
MPSSDDHRPISVFDDVLSNAQKLAIQYLGVSLGLFDAIERNQYRDAKDLAEACHVDLAYTVRWIDAALAAGLVVRVSDRLSLALPTKPLVGVDQGLAVARTMQSIYSILIADAAIPFFRSGERPGYSIVSKFTNLVPYYNLIGSALYESRFSREIIPHILAPIASKSSGIVADYWGGDGYLLKRLVAALPNWIGHLIGNPNGDDSLKTSSIRYVSDREFLEAKEGSYDLVLASRVVHHFGSSLDEKLLSFYRCLSNGGALYVWEFAWPEEDEVNDELISVDNLSFLNLIEHIQGNHFLRKSEIEAALHRAGFQTSRYDLAAGHEVLFEARKIR